MINTSYTRLADKEAALAQRVSSAANDVQNRERVTQPTDTYSGNGVILSLSGQTDFVRVKSSERTTRLAGGSTAVLRLGSRGESVRTLQQTLSQLGYDTGGADGIFGEDTKEAVIAFQKAYELTPDGVVGSDTSRAIAKALDYHNRGILTVGSRGEAVKLLQIKLTSLGFSTKGTDGIFGDNTKNSVITFQRAHGLTEDGIVGNDTIGAIEKALANQNKGTLQKESSMNLTLGSRGEAVVTLQQNLTKLGYDTKGTDGVFGQATRDAVEAFQKAYNLKVDGIVGLATQNAIGKALDYQSRGILTVGSRGEEVTVLQKRLKQLGYYNQSIDGIFGKSTRNAVAALQAAYGQNPDGIVGSATQNAIKQALTRPTNTNSTVAKDTNLRLGSRGDEVSTLQKNLRKLGYSIKEMNGTFGVGTRNTVIKFQKICGLNPDGIVGSATKDAISKALEYQSKGLMGLGVRGSSISLLQKNLTELGYDTKGVDGWFGVDTKKAVMEFQQAFGLTVDGVVGAETQAVIRRTLATNGTKKPILVKDIELSLGSQGDDVRTLQENLTKLGYNTKGTDGVFGANTKKAVKMFQALHNLEVTGIAGRETLQKINEALMTDDSKPLDNWEQRQQMLDNIKNDTSLGLSEDKRTALLTAAERLLRENFDSRFVAGVLGNVLSEGNLGQFENSNYSDESEKPVYLEYMDANFDYASHLSNRSIQTVGISLAMEFALKGKESGVGMFGLGMCQWTGDRTIGVLQSYQKYAQNDKPTTEECIKAEINFMVDELKGEFSYVYLNWMNDNKTAAKAGYIFCGQYEIPGDTEAQAVIRAANAEKIYSVMMK